MVLIIALINRAGWYSDTRLFQTDHHCLLATPYMKHRIRVFDPYIRYVPVRFPARNPHTQTEPMVFVSLPRQVL